MKKILTLIFTFLIYLTANSTPYIIPDIGAPGMNTYIEIIADYTDKGYFGADGFYPNNPGDKYRIELLNGIDSNRVTFGPYIVSWSGRLLTTQVFVNPSLNPPSWDHNLNGPPWSVNFSIKVDINNTSSFEFKIVKPFPFPTNAERVFGTGLLGKRSFRGAMIVDSLVLDKNALYTVSTSDPDVSAGSLGNEGYLPFILLSKGPIVVPSSTTISISSLSKNAAAGGGGGGGKNCDNATADVGGDGFTGGGEGGQYYAFGGTTEQKKAGNGSGKNGAVNVTGDALNGTRGGLIINKKESSGGGTGHPFGQSGTGWSGSSGQTGQGYFGGATGGWDNIKGGSGGYASNGEGSDGTYNGTNNGGKKHGNDMGVPLAGGSGGASGNPRGVPFACSGAGGAGGGAIRIFGSKISDINIEAKGANGEGGAPSGGSGSGGFIEINSQLPSGISNLNVAPGIGGGAGRVRNNTPLMTSSKLINSSNATNYFGFTTDTLTWCNPTFDLKGTCPINAKIKVYLKPEHGKWMDLGYVGNTASGNWSINIDTKALGIDKEKLYYTVARMDVNNPNKVNDSEQDPDYIFSQSAANVIRPMIAPDISSQNSFTYNLKFCKDAEILDSTDVTNTGNDDLIITYSNLWIPGGRGFTFVGPITYPALKPNEKVNIKFKYKPIPGQSGLITDTLYLNNNILNPKKNPWKIGVNVNLQTIKIQFEDLNKKKLDTLFFAQACVGNPDTVFFNLKNLSSIDFPIDKIFTDNKTDFFSTVVDVNPSTTISVNDTRKVRVIFDDKDGNFADIGTKLYVSSKDCPEIIDSIQVMIKILKTNLALVDPSEVDFVDTKIGTTKKRFIRVINNGTNGAYIKTSPIISAPFKLISTKPTLPAYLKMGDTLTLEVDYTPIAEVTNKITTTILSIQTDTSCNMALSFDLQGKGIRSLINFPTDTIRFKKILICDTKQSTNVAIGNDVTSKSAFTILGDKITGPQASSFSIIQYPNLKTFKPGDNDKYWITYLPPRDAIGVSNATLEIYTDDDLNKTIKVYLKGELEGLMMTIDKPNPLDFGDVPIYSTKKDNFKVTNNGTITLPTFTGRNIISIEAKPELKITPSFAKILSNGGTQVFNVDFTPTVPGPFYSDVRLILGGGDCVDTLNYSIIGNGLKGVVDISGTLDFGVKNPCQSETGNIIVTSTGTAPIKLDTVYIQGGDANLFSLSKVTPIVLNKNENATLVVTYAPKGKSYGIKATQIIVLTTANGKQDTTRRNVTVEVISGLVLTPQPLIDFGSDAIGLDVKRNAVLEKSIKALWNLNIEMSQVLKKYPNIFKFNKSQIDNYNFGISNTLSITANGPVNLLYEDTLFIPFIMNNDCRDTAYFALKYNAVPAASIKLRLLDYMSFNPEDAISKIPIYGYITSGLDTVKQATFDNINLTFDQNIFYPKSVNKGKILEYKAINGMVTLRIQTDSTLLTKNETLIAEVIGDALLGQNENSVIILDSIVNSQKKLISKVDTSKGLISIKICRAGGNRLIDNSLAMKLVALEINDYIQLEANVLEIGKHTIELLDATGSLVQKFDWEHNSNSNKIYNFEIQSDKMSNGAYFLIFKSPNRAVTQSIFIIK